MKIIDEIHGQKGMPRGKKGEEYHPKREDSDQVREPGVLQAYFQYHADQPKRLNDPFRSGFFAVPQSTDFEKFAISCRGQIFAGTIWRDQEEMCTIEVNRNIVLNIIPSTEFINFTRCVDAEEYGFITNEKISSANVSDTFDNLVRRDENIVRGIARYVIRKFKESRFCDLENKKFTISTESMKDVFKYKVDEMGVLDAIRTLTKVVPPGFKNWRHVAWRLVSDLLAYRIEDQAKISPDSPVFLDEEAWVKHFISIPKKICENQGLFPTGKSENFTMYNGESRASDGTQNAENLYGYNLPNQNSLHFCDPMSTEHKHPIKGLIKNEILSFIDPGRPDNGKPVLIISVSGKFY